MRDNDHQITASWGDLQSEARAETHATFHRAVQWVEETFGNAKAHTELVGALVVAVALREHGQFTKLGAQDIQEGLTDVAFATKSTEDALEAIAEAVKVSK